MKKNKCVICQKVKGKRLCKIKEKSSICPKCCADIRDDSCSGCSYYSQAEKYSIDKMKKSDFKHFTALIDPEVDEAVYSALGYVGKGNIKKAETMISRLIEENPDLYIVQYGMGVVLGMKGDYTGSLVHFDKCLDIFPYFAEAWFNKGTSHQKLLDLGQTIKSFQKVLDLGDPNEDYVKSASQLLRGIENNLGEGLTLDLYLQSIDVFDDAFSMMQNGDYEKALKRFHDVLSIDTTHCQTYGNMGLCYGFLGERQKALDALNAALKIDPDYEPAITNKRYVECLAEGEKLPQAFKTKVVEYYKDVVEKSNNG